MDNRRMNNGRKKKGMRKREINVKIEVERTSGENFFRRKRERVLSCHSPSRAMHLSVKLDWSKK